MGNVVEIPNVNFDELVQIEKGLKEQKTVKASAFDEKNYLDTRLKKGETKREIKIRLLPNPEEPGFSPFIKVHTHTLSKLPKEISESGYKSYICLEKTNIDVDKYGKKCPFCELQREAYNESTKVMTEAENKVKELENKYKSLMDSGNTVEAKKVQTEMFEIKKEAEIKKQALQKLSISNIARETVIMRVIERGRESEGPKFWKVNVARRGDDAYSLIKSLAERLYKEGAENGIEENLYDSFKGRDITLTISGSDNDKDNKTTMTVTQALTQSPISKDEELMRTWIYDSKKWSDVFAVKPYEYLSIISKGEIPWFDREQQKWVSKEVFDEKREEHDKNIDNEINAQISAAEQQVSGMFLTEDEEDLPF